MAILGVAVAEVAGVEVEVAQVAGVEVEEGRTGVLHNIQ